MKSNMKIAVDSYRKLVSERFAHELGMTDAIKATGNTAAARHHRTLVAEVCRSKLERWPAIRIA